MLNFDPTEAQKNLIESLRNSFNEKQEELTPNEVRYFSSRGSMADNMKLVNQYVCHCGSKTESNDHMTILNNNGSAIDSYNVSCNSCGNLEKISFYMLKKTLTSKFQPISSVRSENYPYI